MRRLIAVVLAMSAPGAAHAYPRTEVQLEGHGFGHGRGLGQWGAYGYAVDHGSTSAQILDHFYGGTTSGNIGNPTITVWLSGLTGPTTVVQEHGHMSTPLAPGRTFTALRAVADGGRLRIEEGQSCSGPWTMVVAAAPTAEFLPQQRNDDHGEMLQLCESSGVRWLRGDIVSTLDSGTQHTTNRLPIDDYLRGVVPRESPASWGDAAGGKGMQALRAQAVAARSYAHAENRYAWAKTCDTESCQVYRGRAQQSHGGGFTSLEHRNTDRAIAETSGQVRVKGSATARTEFSSSTGGHTAGGVFPAVPDDGDDVAANPHHTWTHTLPVPAIEQAYPQIGALESIAVTERNNLGPDGGRVKEISIDGTRGAASPTGNEFRLKFGLRSDWFRVKDANGYWIAGSDGKVFAFGGAEFKGDLSGRALDKPIVGMASMRGRPGYWLVATDGGIFSFGDAAFKGSMGGKPLDKPMVAMAATTSGNGYWTVASDGGIFSFGDATFKGSMGGKPLDKPMVGMSPTRSGNGYWTVATDGGIFSFGDATFKGSMGGKPLDRPMVGMTPTPTGNGYWTVASDGGIFSFGDARFFGSMGGKPLARPIVGMTATPSGGGYWMVSSDGGIFSFGDAQFYGSVPGIAPSSTTTKVAMATAG